MLLKTEKPESLIAQLLYTPSTSTASSETSTTESAELQLVEASPPAADAQPVLTPEQTEHLEFVNRLVKLRLVESTYCTSKRVYSTIRSYRLFALGLLPAEMMVGAASCVVTSVARVLPVPPQGALDNALCKGLDVVKFVLPCVDEEPKEIILRLSPVLQICTAVRYLQKASWDSANSCFHGNRNETVIAALNEAARVVEELLDTVLPEDEGLPAYNEYVEKLWAVVVAVTTLPEIYISWILNYVRYSPPTKDEKLVPLPES